MIGCDLEFVCELCEGQFAMNVCLIQHQRNICPAEYNSDRMMRRRGLGKELKESGLWLSEEVETLARLERVFER